MQFVSMTHKTLGALLAAALMAFAANCFLKYLWWTACYSAWTGIPKMAGQWKAAGSRASFNGWSVIVLEFASVAVLFTLLHWQSSKSTGLLGTIPRVLVSIVLSIVGTGLFALTLAWVNQGQ